MLKGLLATTVIGLFALVQPQQSLAGGDQMLGEVRMFAGTFAPRGWAYCDGRKLPVSTNTALFSILGTQYGGNGRTDFALPDMRKVEEEMRKTTGSKNVPRHIIAITGTFPSRP